jgi:hypothetical protein
MLVKPSTGDSVWGQSDGGSDACTPEKRVVPDIVIPFYERDLCKLKKTALSLVTHDPLNNLGDLYLMWVSRYNVSDYSDQLSEIVEKLTTNKRKVHILDFSKPASASSLSGWHAQQLLKLKIASVVKSEFYIVMDSKNTLVNRVEEDTFFTADNQARIFASYTFHEIPPPHDNWYKMAAKALNVTPPTDMHYPASITPILLHRQTVLDMLASIGEGSGVVNLCDGPLCRLFGIGARSGEGTTEFTMYNMYLYTKTKLACTSKIEAHNQTQKTQWAISLWRGVDDDPNATIQGMNFTLHSVVNGSIKPIMFGSQPGSLDALDETGRKEMVGLLEKIYARAGVYKQKDSKTAEELIECVVGTFMTPTAEKSDASADCVGAYQDCSRSKCCLDPGNMCYQKDEYYATCKAWCQPGIDYSDPDDTVPWTCEELGNRTPWA